MWFTKELKFCYICSKYILSERLWLVNMYFDKVQSGFCVSLLEVGSSWVIYHGAHFHSDSDRWFNLKLLYLELEDQLGSVLKFFFGAFLTICAILLFNLRPMFLL